MEQSLDIRDVDPNPIRQFQKWFNDAIKEKLIMPEAMSLATVSNNCAPSLRVVLLKEVDERGFVFYTNYRSRKGEELAANSRAALSFYWAALSRQVRIEGTVEKTSAQESDAYFAIRPRNSQIGGVASPQSKVIASREELDRLYDEVENRYRGQPVPRPSHWGGYRLKPVAIEFWQGRDARLHDRIVYESGSDGRWKISRLAP